MIKRSLLILQVFFYIQILTAQPMIKWEQLTDVKVHEKFSNSLGIGYYEVQFGKNIQQFDDQELILYGYLIPLDALGERYVLSQSPIANCFFCGSGGPETVVELQIKAGKAQRYATDERRAFRGRLQLNRSSLEHFNYVLIDAEPL